MTYETLVQHYESVCAKLPDWQPRFAINNALEALEDHLLAENPFVIIMELPTSYGKSAMTLALAKAAVSGNPFFSRIIHVLPMRTIADDLYSNLIEWFSTLGLNPKTIGVQHMGSPGSPFLAKKCVVVTLDTFMLSLFKAPAYELAKLIKHNIAHFEFPRGNIYSSMVVFDEFHLFSPMASFKEESKNLGTVIRTISLLALTGVPVIIMSATMPQKIVQFIDPEFKKYGIKTMKICYEPSIDPFEEDRSKKKLKLESRSERILDLIMEKLEEQKKKILVVVNDVKNAVNIYCDLKNNKLSPLLLHGRLPEKIKKKSPKELKEANLLVATQVVEAGINASFDVLISEICPPDRLIQRMGRVARSRGHDEGEVLVVNPLSEHGVYDDGIIRETLGCVQQISSEIYRSRSAVETELYEIMNKIYDKREPPRFEKDLLKALEMLDMDPALDKIKAKKVIEWFNGLTDAFGIVTAFDAEDIMAGNYWDYRVGLPEDMAKTALKRTAKVVQNGSVKTLSSNQLNKLLNSSLSLSLSLIDKDFEGIVVEKIDKEIGFVG